MTQEQKVLNYMEIKGTITALEAMKMGILRLSARIYDLKRSGHRIGMRRERVRNADGTYSTIAVYFLVQKMEEL